VAAGDWELRRWTTAVNVELWTTLGQSRIGVKITVDRWNHFVIPAEYDVGITCQLRLEEPFDRLGGAASLEASARDTGAFLHARVIECAIDLLRVILVAIGKWRAYF
jgi:hypothetical protein